MLLNSLILLTIQNQRKRGIYYLDNSDSDLREPKDRLLGDIGSNVDNTGKGEMKDGYWVVISQWSQCSLKCGGGTSTLQRLCMPPVNGGKWCIGESVMTKPCNDNPCPVNL